MFEFVVRVGAGTPISVAKLPEGPWLLSQGSERAVATPASFGPQALALALTRGGDAPRYVVKMGEGRSPIRVTKLRTGAWQLSQGTNRGLILPASHSPSDLATALIRGGEPPEVKS